jgi:hypothetical protein
MTPKWQLFFSAPFSPKMVFRFSMHLQASGMLFKDKRN